MMVGISQDLSLQGTKNGTLFSVMSFGINADEIVNGQGHIDMSPMITDVIDNVLSWLNFTIPDRNLEVVQDLCVVQDHKSLLRSLFLLNIGIKESESREGIALQGPLDDLKASNIICGPFGIMLTNNPKEHLTFGIDGGRRVLRILSLDKIFALYCFQRVGLMRHVSSYISIYIFLIST